MPSEVSQCVSAVRRTHIDRSLCESGLPETSSLSPRRTCSALRTAGSKCPSFNNGHQKRAFLALWALFRSHDPAENERNVRICHPETDCAWAMGFDTTVPCSTQTDARRAEPWKFARHPGKCEPVKSGPTGLGLSSSKWKRMSTYSIRMWYTQAKSGKRRPPRYLHLTDSKRRNGKRSNFSQAILSIFDSSFL